MELFIQSLKVHPYEKVVTLCDSQINVLRLILLIQIKMINIRLMGPQILVINL